MPSQTKYPSTITQTSTGVPYKNWTNLTNLKSDDNKDARCNNIATKSGSYKQPGPLKATGFGFNIPSVARIDSIEVQYEHFKISHSSSTAHINIAAPTADFLNTGAPARKLSAPPTTRTKYGYKWNRGTGFTPTPAQVNSGLFGVTFNYPANTSSNPGDLALDYIRLVVTYTMPTYRIQMSTPNNTVLGGNVQFKIDVTNTNGVNSYGTTVVDLVVPSGLSFVSATGNGTYNNTTKKWNVKLNSTSATLSITFKSTTTGSKTLKATESSTLVNISRSVTILAPTYNLSSTLPENGTQYQQFTYTIRITTNSDYINNVNVDVPIPAGFTLNSATGNGTYNTSTQKWNAVFNNKSATLTLKVTPNVTGEVTQTISYGTQSVAKTIYLISASLTETFYMKTPFPAETLAQMRRDTPYRLCIYCKVVDAGNRPILSGPKNYRLEVVNGDSSYFSNRVTALNEWQLLEMEFLVSTGVTPELIFHGGYIGAFEEDITVYWSTKMHIELLSTWDLHETFSDVKSYFNDTQLLLEDGDFAETTLDSLKSTNEHVFSDINLAGLDTGDIILTGIGVTGNIVSTGNIVVNTSISGDNINSTMKSQIIQPDMSNFNVGGEFDNWGLTITDLNTIGFNLNFQNNTAETVTVSVNNIRLVLYYRIDLTGGQPGFTVDGVHSSTFNIFLTELNLPGGIKNEVKSVDIEGADGELPIRSNIKPVDIKIEFSILADCSENSYAILERIAKYLENERDSFNKPLLKSVIFDVKPDKKYYYILEDLVDAKNDEGELECDTTFNIPSGTAESLVETITGEYGENSGLTKVYPTIQFISTGGSSLTLLESVTGNEFKINTSIPSGTILTLDAKTNTLTASNGVNYNGFIDINSDYIVLNTAYDFSNSTNLVVQEVRFKEQI